MSSRRAEGSFARLRRLIENVLADLVVVKVESLQRALFTLEHVQQNLTGLIGELVVSKVETEAVRVVLEHLGQRNCALVSDFVALKVEIAQYLIVAECFCKGNCTLISQLV